MDSNREAVDQLDLQQHRENQHQHRHGVPSEVEAVPEAGSLQSLSHGAGVAGAGIGEEGGNAMAAANRGHGAGSTRGGQFFGGGESRGGDAGDSRGIGGSVRLSPAATTAARGRQRCPSGEGWDGADASADVGSDEDIPRGNARKSRRDNAASPQFRFRGHLDGSTSGGEEGGKDGGAAAVSFALAMDQSP